MKLAGTNRAKGLRKRMTDAERRIWFALRDRRLSGHKFKRQVAIDPWIVDFLCVEARLVIEVDGGQHAESERDARRDKNLAERGYRVLRFWNTDVLLNTRGVLETILLAVEERANIDPRVGTFE